MNAYFQNSCTVDLSHSRDPRMQRIIDYLCQKLGLGKILVFEANIDNACATYYDVNTPIITYNPYFIQAIESRSWPAVIAILTHEVIHHYNKDLHRIQDNSFLARFIVDLDSHRAELNADMFAGWVLHHEGFTLQQALEVYDVYEFKLSRTHPSKSKRQQAMREGWCAATNNKDLQEKSGISSREVGGLVGLGIVAILFGALLGAATSENS